METKNLPLARAAATSFVPPARVLAPVRRGRRRQEVAAGDVHVAATRADAADRGPPPHKWNRCTKPSGGSVARDSETDKDVSQAVR